MSDDRTKLFAKLARVTQKMKRIRKTGKHPTQGYQFATDTDIIEAVSEAMADENMACIASMIGHQVLDGGATGNNKPIFHTICEFEFVFVCGDTGATMACRWFNEALDSSDKGFNKAATAALKYFFMKTFLITTGEPDEHETGDIQPGQTQKQRQNASQSNSKGTQNGAAKQNGKPVAETQNAANGASSVISDDWDKPAIEAFVQHYGNRMTMTELLASLQVQRFGEWKHGGVAAYKVVDGELAKREMAF